MTIREEFERERWTLCVRVEPTSAGGACIRLGPHPELGTHQVNLTAATLANWTSDPAGYTPSAFRSGRLGSLLRQWLAMSWPLEPPFTHLFHRLALRVAHSSLAELSWERAFREADVWNTVRVSPTPPMAADLPLTFPLRFLQINPSRSRFDAKKEIGKHSWVGPAVVVGQCSLREVGVWSRKPDWPTAEVLHFAANLPAPDDPALLSTARPDELLSVGGLGRLTSRWQTRLVVFECKDAKQVQSALLLGTALADRGGPAVMVLRPGPAGRVRKAIWHVYFDIIHDKPLDLGRAEFSPELTLLIAGVGREELIRPSNVVRDIEHMNESLRYSANWSILADPGTKATSIVVIGPLATGAWKVGVPGHWSPYRTTLPMAVPGLKVAGASPFKPFAKQPHRADVAAVRKVLRDSVVSKAGSYVYKFSEGQGTGPAAAGVGQIRKQLAIPGQIRRKQVSVGSVLGAGSQPRAGRERTRHAKQTKKKWQHKYVNPLLAKPESGGREVEMRPDGKPLRVGELYHLFVDIGRPREHVRVIGASALQEVHLRSKDEEGVWVEIGLTGLDFELDGAPVRELWVPSDDRVSQAVAFAIRPKKAGTARLRYSVYVRQNLVHSYVLAARTVDGSDGPGRAADLAAALGTPGRKVGRSVWLARLEYSLSGRLVDRPPRALSIVTNHVAKESTVTVKGADTFSVRTAGDLTDLTAAIRERLDEIATPPRPDIKDKRLWPYGFGTQQDANAGSPAKLEKHLMALAELGWELYDKVIPASERPGVAANLAGNDQIIHVASILLDEVIPWSLAYDHPYDADMDEDENGDSVEHAACLASLPAADGTLPVLECGKSPQCVLHATQLAARAAAGQGTLKPETVACPRHFWGFRHLVELPPQQTESAQSATEQALVVNNSGRPKMALGVHGGLSQHSRHIGKLGTDLGTKVAIAAPAYKRDPVIRALDRDDLDIVYLYCHAEGGVGSELRVPVLKFREPKETKDGVIKAAQLLGKTWAHRPLVIVNGCRSGAFRPDALSPFIDKLITDRSGGAFIGTEISVWEALATQLGEWVLADFANGTSIGVALARARRRLLSIHNPLGLVYTLYGATELALARPV